MQHELDKPTSEPFHHLIQKYYNAIYYRLKWYHVRVGSLLHSTSHDDGITTSLVQAPQSQQMLQKVSQQSVPNLVSFNTKTSTAFARSEKQLP